MIDDKKIKDEGWQVIETLSNRNKFLELEIMKLEASVHSLESQLKIEWDDERVKEIEKYWDNLMPIEDGITDNAPILNGRIHIHYLLSLLKKERVKGRILQFAVDRWVPCPDHRDKMERGKCYICKIEKLEREKKELQEGIKKHRDYPFTFYLGIKLKERDEELYKLVEEK
jgi:hypothetical protein